MLSACKKPVTRVIKFTSTTYQTLGTYNSSGEPNYLVTPDTISSALLSFINTTLPGGQNLTLSHPELFSASTAIADIKITQQSDVYVTFVEQDGQFANSLAFYTYPTIQPPASTSDIKLITYAFPNSGHLTPLKPGDKVKIGRFDVGTSIGFVLMQNAWDTTTSKLNNDAVHFCTNDILNPEADPNLRKHAVLINYAPENKTLVGFEDNLRTSPKCDNDFNDVLIYTTVKP